MFSLEQEKLTNELNESRADRYRQIAEVLARHGLENILTVVGLDRFLGRSAAQA